MEQTDSSAGAPADPGAADSGADSGAASVRRPGRPARTVLDPARIVGTARRLMAEGNADFTMSRLARTLGVATSSLYNHVGSRDEVLARISDDVVAGIELTGLEDFLHRAPELSGEALLAAWREAVTSWALSYYAAFAAQPALVSSLALTPVAQAPGTLVMYQTLVQTFLAAGWAEDRVLDAVETLEAFLLGAALDAGAPADIFDPGQRADRHPEMARVHAARGNLPGPAASRRVVRLGLPGLLDGLARERSSRP